jgi:hypothetical protein
VRLPALHALQQQGKRRSAEALANTPGRLNNLILHLALT